MRRRGKPICTFESHLWDQSHDELQSHQRNAANGETRDLKRCLQVHTMQKQRDEHKLSTIQKLRNKLLEENQVKSIMLKN